MSDTRTPLGVRVIAVINLVAAVITVAFWALVYARLFAPGPPADPVLRASSAATLGFLIGDLIWAVPLLALSVAGLWRLRPWGWLVGADGQYPLGLLDDRHLGARRLRRPGESGRDPVYAVRRLRGMGDGPSVEGARPVPGR